MMMRRQFLNVLLPAAMLLLLVAACKKYADSPGARTDPRFERRYCNVPEAVNYNWNFPGTPDSSDAVCFYPSDIFEGHFIYSDSIYNGNNVLVREETRDLTIVASSHTAIVINGFCPSLGLPFTANRLLHADADSNTAAGHLLCNDQDTLSGYIYRTIEDTLHIQFAFTVGSDTGTYYHRGTAVKQ